MSAQVTEVELERRWLDEHTWIDVARGFVEDAESVYGVLAETVPWTQGRLWRYERWVDEPRVTRFYRRTAPYPHRVLADVQRAIQDRYRVMFDGVALSWYRDGTDSVAFHRDRDMRFCEDTIVAILTFGACRPWLLRPRGRADKWVAPHGGATHDLAPRSGDLMVLGGRAQVDWEHAVPKVHGPPGRAGRISAQWRYTSRRGRPEVGPSYRAARVFASSGSGVGRRR